MKNFKQFTRDNEPLILEGPMWDDIKAKASSALASAKSGVKNYFSSGTAWDHTKAIGRGIGDTAVGAIKYTAKAGGAAIGGVIGGVKNGTSGSHGGNNNDYNGKNYDKGKKSGEKEGRETGLEQGRREAKEAGDAASAANRGHNDTVRKFALSKGFDYDKEGGAHRFGVYANALRTNPDKVGHDSAGRPYNKKADGSQGGWFGGTTGNTAPHTDADWSEHEKARDALIAAGRASGIKR